MAHRIVVTGAGGQLGKVLVRDLQKAHEVFGLTRESLDVADRAAVRERVAKLRPTVVVNGAAFNDVDGAEDDPKAAIATNGFGVGALADAAAAADAILIHFSSDFVFDGRTTRPYTEKDLPNPLSLYGASKLLGDVLAPRAPKHWILRLASVFGGEGRTSSIGKMAEMLAKGEPVKAFYDRTVTPSYVEDVSRTVQMLFERKLPLGPLSLRQLGDGHVARAGDGAGPDDGVEDGRLGHLDGEGRPQGAPPPILRPLEQPARGCGDRASGLAKHSLPVRGSARESLTSEPVARPSPAERPASRREALFPEAGRQPARVSWRRGLPARGAVSLSSEKSGSAVKPERSLSGPRESHLSRTRAKARRTAPATPRIAQRGAM